MAHPSHTLLYLKNYQFLSVYFKSVHFFIPLVPSQNRASFFFNLHTIPQLVSLTLVLPLLLSSSHSNYLKFKYYHVVFLLKTSVAPLQLLKQWTFFSLVTRPFIVCLLITSLASFAATLQSLPLNYILHTITINILDFENYMSSVATIQHCSCSTKQPQTICK